MGKVGIPMKKYNYYKLAKSGARRLNEQYCGYSDIALEYNTTRGTIAGKFYRAKQRGENFIKIGNVTIEREEAKTWEI